MPDDFYMIEDDSTGYGSGKIEIAGKTVNFHFQTYGAVVDFNVDGTKYPQIFGSTGDWQWSFPGAYRRAGEDRDDDARKVPEGFITQVADKIVQAFMMRLESDTIEQIASHIEPEGPLDDSDEFEEDGHEITFSHIKDGHKIRMPEGSKPSEFIKKLPTKHEAPEPPLPKGLYRDPPVKRDRWGDEDPREDDLQF